MILPLPISLPPLLIPPVTKIRFRAGTSRRLEHPHRLLHELILAIILKLISIPAVAVAVLAPLRLAFRAFLFVAFILRK